VKSGLIRGVFSLEESSLVVFSPLLSGQISDAMRQQHTTKLLPSRDTTPLIRPDFRCTEIEKYY
jgi:hypothetical protein